MALTGSRAYAHRAWDSLGNGALFTTRIRRLACPDIAGQIRWQRAQQSIQSSPVTQMRCWSTVRSQQPPRPSLLLQQQRSSPTPQSRRVLQTSQKQPQEAQTTPAKAYRDEVKSQSDPADLDEEDGDGFRRTARAAQASQINLSAKLTKESSDKQGGGWQEVKRLLMIAWPEKYTLGIAVVFLLVSSSISMSVPFSIGKILDAASSKEGTLFGLSMEQFYIALGSLLLCGAAANYGRIVLLRIVGERSTLR